MKQTFKAEPGITVTVEVETDKNLSRLEMVQIASQTLMLHGQALAAPIETEGEEISEEQRFQEIELDEAEVLEKGYV